MFYQYEHLEEWTIFAHWDILEHVHVRSLVSYSRCYFVQIKINILQSLHLGSFPAPTNEEDWSGFFPLSHHFLTDYTRVFDFIPKKLRCPKLPQTVIQSQAGKPIGGD